MNISNDLLISIRMVQSIVCLAVRKCMSKSYGKIKQIFQVIGKGGNRISSKKYVIY